MTDDGVELVVRRPDALRVRPLRAPQSSERDSMPPTQHFKRGMQALLGEQFDTAEREFSEAVTLDPLYDAAFYGLGQVYMATKRFDWRSRRTSRRATRSSPRPRPKRSPASRRTAG